MATPLKPNTPLGKIPRSGLAAVPHPHKCSRSNIFRQFNLTVTHLAVANPEDLKIGFCPIALSPNLFYSRGCNFGSQSAVLDLAVLFVFLRSFPPFPLYSSAGAIDGGGGAN